MYEVYLRSAVDSQRGEITTEQSKQYIQGALRGWQQRWKTWIPSQAILRLPIS